MRVGTGYAVVTGDVALDSAREGEATESVKVGAIPRAGALASAARVEVHDVAKRIMDELSHDLRQPLTSMTMNLQSAIRVLRAQQPNIGSAV
jgi:phosphoglycerate-specific signal transduction histidine kinase